MSAPVLELRALDVMNTVPAEHGALMIVDDAFEPHLQVGELAIFDAADREPQHGELYVFEVRTPRVRSGLVRRVFQARRTLLDFGKGEIEAWWLRSEFNQGISLSEGPLDADEFLRQACGRIVGVLELGR